MGAERTEQYFHSFDSDALPSVDWQEMLDKRVVFAPQNILAALKEAEQLLVSHPGPNLERRKVLAPEWFGYWKDLLIAFPYESDTGLMFSGDKLVKFEDLSRLLESRYKDENTGMIFVAGAEGHKGHIHAAKYMASVVPVTVWGFEQDEYMQRKARKAPFLPLQLRLSMWFYEPTVTHLAVLPSNLSGLPDNDHYNELFIMAGVKYFFVHEKDPYLSQKLVRGGQDLDRTIRHPFHILSTTEAVQELMPEVSLEEIYYYLVRQNLRVIPDLPAERISERVKKLFSDDGSFAVEGQVRGFQRPPSKFTDFDLLGDEVPVSYGDTIFIE
ncbi:hypothetical protein A2715_01920 [Candidatus Woesebacteria bacterium RIFCSPHIGHO2_01_FULL_39_32]|uniref:Uncharacterized protein n=2 Tax=Candidatus Woeseibacteriota TaxID=1752722 RepID=A0A0G0PSE7_9BACT|nr:MAG: hypothetical protein UT61_C0001G0022 [Candidatus Woesebacteria bacterium GW2011_GWA1_39_8]OGM03867.1 MAG: hypothetical protein A2124_04535 [Candidatus Woesebacteria bacterium GWB1_37_5]OGM23914.1 MAG: hypothetical protein A2715_01920 [Candidatus Woesebacteria bacterium RIFCSPHIGHO2_01_FULL_39_32]OGM37421.1 MAG: hypothetical protein A3F01_03155 [Candidatus Woesebacteria bacterium RIFCSPHIGHO2_12_FULL_38_11]OGM64103.1 MAG: hypothetical protein A2893_03160 [Candidatus Woesebacteria bacteri